MKPWMWWALLGLLFVGGGAAVYTMTRGLRNNNPGNIRKSNTAWQGLSPTQTDDSFFQFTTPEYGIRALNKVLDTYSKSYGLDTVAEIISRWAPPNENDTASYINAVSHTAGVSPNQTLGPEHRLGVIRGIITHENGLQPYDDATFQRALAMA